MVASHLIREPVSMAYDQVRRLLHVAMADGGLATLTLFRAEQVTGWTRQETQGAFRAVAETEGRVFCVVQRGATHRLERFDAALNLDAALEGRRRRAAGPLDRPVPLEGMPPASWPMARRAPMPSWRRARGARPAGRLRSRSVCATRMRSSRCRRS
jgi:hypothetical protein